MTRAGGVVAKHRLLNSKGTLLAGWYELKTNDKGQYVFVLKAGNGEVILRSEHYKSRNAAMKGILSVQSNCTLEERYDPRDAADGGSYFNLKAGNHQIIGTSQMYKSVVSRNAGIESVKTNGQSPVIKTEA